MQARPFHRAIAMAHAISLIFQAFPLNQAARAAALAGLGAYESHGKGGKRAHRIGKVAGAKRAALKARNVKRNRRAHL